jgi:hypothetical protein
VAILEKIIAFPVISYLRTFLTFNFVDTLCGENVRAQAYCWYSLCGEWFAIFVKIKKHITFDLGVPL